MRGFTEDTEEIFRYVMKNSAGAEDASGVFLDAFADLPDCFAFEILKRLNYRKTTVPKRRVTLSPERVAAFADELAGRTGYAEIDSQHLLLAVAGCKNCEGAEALRRSGIGADAVARVVEGMSYHRIGMAGGKTFGFDPKCALGIAEKLKTRVVGQDEAIDAVAGRLKRAAAGLGNPNRPIAAFLFTGSTGVGKTELAKAIAETLYGADALVRFDMSEYSEKASVTALVGAPPAYVGFEEGGRLTRRIAEKPYSVVLFDEIEKAHRDVMNLLLQILDEGTLTDMRGVKVNFTNCIVILTANALSYDIINKKRGIGFDRTETEADHRALLKETFPPELLGRLKVVRFRDLDRLDYKKILGLEIDGLNRRLEGKRLSVTLSEGAADALSEDTGYGVRGIRRRVEEALEAKLSDGILSGEIPDDANIEVGYFRGEILLNIKTTEEQKA